MFTSFCLFATKTEHKYKQADKKIRIAVEKRITSYIQDNNAVKTWQFYLDIDHATHISAAVWLPQLKMVWTNSSIVIYSHNKIN